MWEEEQQFRQKLVELTFRKPPISASRINAIAKEAVQYRKHHKQVVSAVEKFVLQCRPEYRLSSLYIVDAICRYSRSKLGDKDVYIPRFARHFPRSFAPFFQCVEEDKPKVVRVISLWAKNHIFPESTLRALKELSLEKTGQAPELLDQELEEPQQQRSDSPSPPAKAASPKEKHKQDPTATSVATASSTTATPSTPTVLPFSHQPTSFTPNQPQNEIPSLLFNQQPSQPIRRDPRLATADVIPSSSTTASSSSSMSSSSAPFSSSPFPTGLVTNGQGPLHTTADTAGFVSGQNYQPSAQPIFFPQPTNTSYHHPQPPLDVNSFLAATAVAAQMGPNVATSHSTLGSSFMVPQFDYGEDEDDETRIAEQKKLRLEQEMRLTQQEDQGNNNSAIPTPSISSSLAVPSSGTSSSHEQFHAMPKASLEMTHRHTPTQPSQLPVHPYSQQQPPQQYQPFNAEQGNLNPNRSGGEFVLKEENVVAGRPDLAKVQSTTCFLGHLPPGTTEEDLSHLFGSFGKIRIVKLLADQNTAFLTFESRISAENAKEAAEQRGLFLGGKAIKVGWARGNNPVGTKDDFDRNTGETIVSLSVFLQHQQRTEQMRHRHQGAGGGRGGGHLPRDVRGKEMYDRNSHHPPSSFSAVGASIPVWGHVKNSSSAVFAPSDMSNPHPLQNNPPPITSTTIGSTNNSNQAKNAEAAAAFFQRTASSFFSPSPPPAHPQPQTQFQPQPLHPQRTSTSPTPPPSHGSRKRRFEERPPAHAHYPERRGQDGDDHRDRHWEQQEEHHLHHDRDSTERGSSDRDHHPRRSSTDRDRDHHDRYREPQRGRGRPPSPSHERRSTSDRDSTERGSSDRDHHSRRSDREQTSRSGSGSSRRDHRDETRHHHHRHERYHGHEEEGTNADPFGRDQERTKKQRTTSSTAREASEAEAIKDNGRGPPPESHSK
ncbi:nucleic acid binding [Balamuthia mandrillaris]